MKKCVKYYLVLLFSLFFIFGNNDIVYADGGYCAVNMDVQEAYECDYSSDNAASKEEYSIIFIKHSGGYCAEISDLSLTVYGGFFSNIANDVTLGWTFQATSDQSFETQKRKVATIGLSGNDIKKVFDNKSCPSLKMEIFTDGFGETGVKSLNVTNPDWNDGATCSITAGGSLYIDNFCVLSDGSNFRSVDPENAQATIKDASGDRDPGPSGGEIIQSILNWGGKKDGTKYDPSTVDPCALISGDLREALHDIFFFISIAGIIILVVMTAVSLVKVITASEDEALRNFLKGLWKRIICLIILLLLPMLITFIIQVVNNVAPSLGIKSNNPLCDITE